MKHLVGLYSRQPKIGDKLVIEWLPTNNAHPNSNAYIGMSGTVDYLYDNGGFCLNTGSSILCIINKQFVYSKILI